MVKIFVPSLPHVRFGASIDLAQRRELVEVGLERANLLGLEAMTVAHEGHHAAVPGADGIDLSAASQEARGGGLPPLAPPRAGAWARGPRRAMRSIPSGAWRRDTCKTTIRSRRWSRSSTASPAAGSDQPATVAGPDFRPITRLLEDLFMGAQVPTRSARCRARSAIPHRWELRTPPTWPHPN